MATIKSHSDLDQSRKLAEILPLESADMNYWCGTQIRIGGHRTMDKDLDVPAWSLAALLSVLPRYELNNFGDAIQLDVKNEAFVTEGDETLLDLVVNTIIYLHELKML